MVRGLYNAGVDSVHTAAGMFTPERVGVVQYHGAAAEGATEETAEALRRVAAVEAVIASYPQARLATPRNAEGLPLTVRRGSLSHRSCRPGLRTCSSGAADTRSTPCERMPAGSTASEEVLVASVHSVRLDEAAARYRACVPLLGTTGRWPRRVAAGPSGSRIDWGWPSLVIGVEARRDHRLGDTHVATASLSLESSPRGTAAQPGLSRPDDGFSPVGNLQLVEDVGDVIADRLLADHKIAGDLTVVSPLRDQL